MRRMLVLLLPLLYTGCSSGPCGGCNDWQTCNASTKQCELDAHSTWSVTAVDAEIAHEFLTSVPNPYMCLTVGGVEQCTQYATLTFSPSWNTLLFSSVTAAELTGTPLPTRLMATGIFMADNVICQGTIDVDPSIVTPHGFHYNCSNSIFDFGLAFLGHADAGPTTDGASAISDGATSD